MLLQHQLSCLIAALSVLPTVSHFSDTWVSTVFIRFSPNGFHVAASRIYGVTYLYDCAVFISAVCGPAASVSGACDLHSLAERSRREHHSLTLHQWSLMSLAHTIAASSSGLHSSSAPVGRTRSPYRNFYFRVQLVADRVAFVHLRRGFRSLFSGLRQFLLFTLYH